jgi:hypothetical protein
MFNRYVLGMYLSGLGRRLRTLLCPHNTVELVRWHPATVTRAMVGQHLYVDRHGVMVFAKCSHCGKVMATRQRQPLYEPTRDAQAEREAVATAARSARRRGSDLPYL